MTNRFRELERPQTGRLKDVVLMATVTSFESLRAPRKSEMKQFAELFEPLFLGSSDEARRQAAAALSQCAHVPEAVALIIGSMPIAIAAIFLTRSRSIPDRTLISIIRQQGPAHAGAIARRENLSPSVVDALVEHHQPAATAGQFRNAPLPSIPTTPPSTAPAVTRPSAATPSAATSSADRIAREDKLREDIKALTLARSRDADRTSAIRPIGELHQALLVRFARNGEVVLFANALADALQASHALAERILLDVSGQQLAITLAALDFPAGDLPPLLASLYPDLAETRGGSTHAEALLGDIERKASLERVEAWLRADRPSAARHETHLAENRGPDPRQREARSSGALPDGATQPRRNLSQR